MERIPGYRISLAVGQYRGVDLVNEAEKYRLRAAECAEAAEQVSNAEERQSLLVLARAWLMLANRAVQGSLQRMRSRTRAIPDDPIPKP